MIKKCGAKEEGLLLSYIGADFPSCLYLYLDLKQYGLDSAVIDGYVEYDGEKITAVLLKYYSCFHIYSKDNDFDAEELVRFCGEQGFSMLYCTARTAAILYRSLTPRLAEKATMTTGWVAEIKAVDKPPRGLAVPAEQSDFAQIVRLIYEDEDIGRSYKLEELAKQLEERSREGYTRNVVIKQGDLVIAHACTNAELENVAVVAELLVRKEYRRKGYASEVWRGLCQTLLQENKRVFSFYYSEESRSLHKKVGFTEVCEWAKIVIA